MSGKGIAISVTAILVVAGVAGLAPAQDGANAAREKQLRELENRLRDVDNRIRGMEGFYARDPAVVELEKAKDLAGAAYEAEIRKRVKTNSKGATLVTKRPELDARVSELETQWRIVENRIRKMDDVVAFQDKANELYRKAETIRREGDAERNRANALLIEKIEGSPDWTELRRELNAARRERHSARREIDGLRRWLVQPPTVKACEIALRKAEAAYREAIAAEFNADAEVQKAQALVKELGPERKKMDTKRKEAWNSAETSVDGAALKKAWDEAEKLYQEKNAARDKAIADKLSANEDAVKLRRDLKAAKDTNARREIEGKLRKIWDGVRRSKEMAPANQAADEARRNRDVARRAYETRRRELFLADTAAADAEKKLRQLGDAERRVRHIRRKIETGDATKAERAARDAARADLEAARNAAGQKAREAVAATDRGAALMKQKEELAAKIKELKGK